MISEFHSWYKHLSK